MKVTEYCITIFLIFAALLAYPFVKPYLPTPQEKAQEPTIMALDINSIIAETVRQNPGEDTTTIAVQRINETATKLAEQGYIVLRSDDVLAAPEGYVIGIGQKEI